MNHLQKIRWLLLSGVTETIAEEPVNRMLGKTQTKKEEKSKTDSSSKDEISLSQAQILANGVETLTDLYRSRGTFDGCALKKTAAHTLNGRGAENPDVLCYVETPDTADDRSGSLMSGEAGELLNKMLAAIGLNLNQNAYVSSLIPWRPPGNRKPSDVELALCRPFWEKEIDLLKPKVILLLGANVSGAVLGISALSKARGAWHDFLGIPVRVSIPPATLIKISAQKKQAWEDLQQVQKKLSEI